jgi:hypothetical protein
MSLDGVIQMSAEGDDFPYENWPAHLRQLVRVLAECTEQSDG